MKKIFALIGIIALLGMSLVGTLNLWLTRPTNIEPLLDSKEQEDILATEEIEPIEVEPILSEESLEEEIDSILKEKIKINVPFYVQSPFYQMG